MQSFGKRRGLSCRRRRSLSPSGWMQIYWNGCESRRGTKRESMRCCALTWKRICRHGGAGESTAARVRVSFFQTQRIDFFQDAFHRGMHHDLALLAGGERCVAIDAGGRIDALAVGIARQAPLRRGMVILYGLGHIDGVRG